MTDHLDPMFGEEGREQPPPPVERPPLRRRGWHLSYATLAAILVALIGFGLAILGFVLSLRSQADSAIKEAQSTRSELVATRDDLNAARSQLEQLQSQNQCRSQLSADDRVATLATLVSLGQLVQGLETARQNQDANAYLVADQNFDETVKAATAQLEKSRDVDAQCPVGG